MIRHRLTYLDAFQGFVRVNFVCDLLPENIGPHGSLANLGATQANRAGQCPLRESRNHWLSFNIYTDLRFS
jgi:hypothetical protein